MLYGATTSGGAATGSTRIETGSLTVMVVSFSRPGRPIADIGSAPRSRRSAPLDRPTV